MILPFKHTHFFTRGSNTLCVAVAVKLTELGYELGYDLRQSSTDKNVVYFRVGSSKAVLQCRSIHDIPSGSNLCSLDTLFATKVPPAETIKVGSMTYNKAEVEAALKDIKPV